MPYTIKPDGSIVCDTPEEAMKMHRVIMTRQAPIKEPASQTKLDLPVQRSALSPATRFLDSLKPYNGSTVDSKQMQSILGTSITGVGTKLRHIKNSLLSEGKQLDDYLSPCKTDEGY